MTTDLELVPQEELALAERVEPVRGNVTLDLLPPTEALIGPPPTASLIRSVKQVGVLHPVLLVAPDEAGAGYRVAAGRRRIRAARAAGLTEIPAHCYPAGYLSASLVTLIENEQRSENPAANLGAVEALDRTGMTDEQIRDAAGLSSVAAVQHIRKLQRLDPYLRRLWETGKLTHTTAAEVAKLDPAMQAEARATYERERKLTVRMVREIRQARRDAALEELAPALFPAEEPPAEPPAPVPWRDQVRCSVEALLTAAGESGDPDAEWVGHALRKVLAALDQVPQAAEKPKRARKPKG